MLIWRSGLRRGVRVLSARGAGLSILRLLVCGVVGCAVTHRAGADVVNWVRFDGDWAAPVNWSSNPLLPGPGDDAVNPTTSRITHSTGDHTIKSFTGTGPYTLSGGSISAATPGAGTFRVDSGFGFTVTGTGGTLRGFRILPGAAGRPVYFEFNGNSTLDNITSDANLELGFSSVQPGAVVRVTNGLTLNGTATVFGDSVMAFQGNQTLGGTGAVQFNGGGLSQRLAVEGDSTLTIGPDIELRGTASIGRWSSIPGGGKLVNQGRISAEGFGAVLTINPASAALNSVTNSGILEAITRGTLNLNSHVTNTPTGQINADVFGRIQQNGVEITGGTINLSSDSVFVPSASGLNLLNGVKFNGQMDLTTANAIEGVRGGLVLNGIIRIDSNSVLAFDGTQTLSGPSTFAPAAIFFGNAANNRLELTGNGLLTLAANASIAGKNGRVGSSGFGGGQGIENLGVIAANVEDGTIRVEPPALTNRGTIQALQGGTLALTGATLNNTANIFATLGGTVNLAAGAITNSGNIEARLGGVVNVNTNVTNTGQGNIAVTAADGRVNVNGARITGGRINNTQGGAFAFSNSQNNVLEEVVASGSFTLDGGTVRVVNGLTLDGKLDISAGGALAFQGSQRLLGAANITLKPGAADNRVLIEGTSTLRLGPGVIITGPGLIGKPIGAPGTATLINEGAISSNSPQNGTLTIRADAFTNAPGGRLSASFLPLIVETNGPAINQGHIENGFANITFTQGLTQTAGETELGFSRIEMPGKTFTLSGGTLSGVGGIVGDVLNDGGTIHLLARQSFSIGTTGAYTQGPNGRLQRDLEHDIEPSQPLNVGGAAALGGTLDIVRVGGFVPTPYKPYRVLSYASRSGLFAQYLGTAAGNGLVFAPDYQADGLDLVPALPGDANLDRRVDFNDLAALAQNYNRTGGVTWRGGDFTFDANVDFNDLAILAQRYNTAFSAPVAGAPADFQHDWAAAIAQAQVPEPNALWVIVLALNSLLVRRRRPPALSA
jgi:hypothetical protein